MKNYEEKKYDYLNELPGISDVMLKNHFTLYGGYVSNTNKIVESLKKVTVSSPEYNELKRRFGWEYDGMRMHELYFSNLTKDACRLNLDGALGKGLIDNFGSYDFWLADFKAIGMIRGVGWVCLVQDKETNNLFNIWVGEHDLGQLVNTNIILVMDVWEHAYMTDYGLKRADYIASFSKIIDWSVVEKRYIQ